MRFGLVLLLGFIGAFAFLASVASNEDDRAKAAGAHRRIMPGLAADSARPPTPFPTPIYDTERWIKVQVRITALELAITGGGTLPVAINATAKAPLPGVFDPPVTVTGQFSVANEGTDAVGCDWTRVDTSTDFKMTAYYNSAGNLDVLLSFVSPQWHYTITCPFGGPYRSPAFGEEGLELFLRDLTTPYRTSGSSTVRLPLNVVSSPGADPCIKRSGYFSSFGIQTRPAEVFVWVYQQDSPGGCDPSAAPAPPPTPVPTPALDDDLVLLTP